MSPIVMMLAALAGPGGGPEPLVPSGGWQVDYAETHCALTRTFGSGDRTVSLGLIPVTGDQAVKVALITGAGIPLRGYGDAHVTVGGAPANRYTYLYYSYPDPAGGSVALVKWNRARMAELAGAKTITVKLARGHIALTLNGTAKALAALEACENDLWKGWGVDPASIAKAPTLLDRDNVILSSDYPRNALAEGRGGETGFRVNVDAAGKPTACAVTEQSGNADLDSLVCYRLMGRAHFTPATDREGSPVAGIYASAVVWWAGHRQ